MKSLICTVLFLFVFHLGFSTPNQSDYVKKYIESFEEQKSLIFPVKSNQSSLLKSASATKDKLDSIKHQDGSRKLFLYNEAGQLVDYKFYEYDELDEVVVLVEHQVFQYDANGNETLHTTSLNDDFDGFGMTEKYERTYTPDNKLLTDTYWDRDSDGTTRQEYDYTDGMRIDTYDNYANSEEWNHSSYSLVEVDNSDRPILTKTFQNDGAGNFVHVANMTVAYNNDGQMTEMGMQFYDAETDEWSNGMTVYTEYNAAGQITYEKTEGPNMNPEVSEPMIWYETKYYYDNNLLIKKEEYEFSASFDLNTGSIIYILQPSYIDEYNYENGVIVSQVGKEIDDMTQVMAESYRYDFTVNTSYGFDDQIVPFDLDEAEGYYDIFEPDFYQGGRIESVEHFRKDWMGDGLVSKRVATYYYGGGSGIVELSDDATLSDLTVGGNTIDGFAPGTYEYNITLDAGTSIAPEVGGTPNDETASVHVDQTNELPGSAIIQVTAEDGVTQLIYTVNFGVAGSPSSIATLSDLQVDGSTIDGFKSSLYNYDVELPAGTTDAPEISATATDSKATIKVTQASELPGYASVVVTAEDGTKATYSVEFTVAQSLSTDATLTDLQLDGATINGFDAATLTYDVELASDATSAPTVSATATDANASIDITQANDVNGTATVIVTAEDGETTQTYTINFTLETGIIDNKLAVVEAYPNPFNNKLTIELGKGVEKVSVTNLSGQVVFCSNNTNNKTLTIETSAFDRGVYFVQLIDENQIIKQCKVVKY